MTSLSVEERRAETNTPRSNATGSPFPRALTSTTTKLLAPTSDLTRKELPPKAKSTFDAGGASDVDDADDGHDQDFLADVVADDRAGDHGLGVSRHPGVAHVGGV
ncbi:hypothetical protein ACIOHE_06895 [Streptomyces sp. NPDC087851]|uniref:hypothetical protein n=1 Tax=Streptomyces sp. NPDC087851 TaxID=3365810 RepID=UPI00381FB841